MILYFATVLAPLMRRQLVLVAMDAPTTFRSLIVRSQFAQRQVKNVRSLMRWVAFVQVRVLQQQGQAAFRRSAVSQSLAAVLIMVSFGYLLPLSFLSSSCYLAVLILFIVATCDIRLFVVLQRSLLTHAVYFYFPLGLYVFICNQDVVNY